MITANRFIKIGWPRVLCPTTAETEYSEIRIMVLQDLIVHRIFLDSYGIRAIIFFVQIIFINSKQFDCADNSECDRNNDRLDPISHISIQQTNYKNGKC